MKTDKKFEAECRDKSIIRSVFVQALLLFFLGRLILLPTVEHEWEEWFFWFCLGGFVALSLIVRLFLANHAYAREYAEKYRLKSPDGN